MSKTHRSKRPPSRPGRRTVTVTFSLEPEMLAVLDSICKYRGDRTRHITLALHRYLESQVDGYAS